MSSGKFVFSGDKGEMTNSEVIGMLKGMWEKTADTMGFFIGHVTQAWMTKGLLGSKIAELEEGAGHNICKAKTEGVYDEDITIEL